MQNIEASWVLMLQSQKRDRVTAIHRLVCLIFFCIFLPNERRVKVVVSRILFKHL